MVIEHNLDVIKTADQIVDMGPEGGEEGGRLMAAGTPEEVAAVESSHTGAFLRDLVEAKPAKGGRRRAAARHPRAAQGRRGRVSEPPAAPQGTAPGAPDGTAAGTGEPTAPARARRARRRGTRSRAGCSRSGCSSRSSRRS